MSVTDAEIDALIAQLGPNESPPPVAEGRSKRGRERGSKAEPIGTTVASAIEPVPIDWLRKGWIARGFLHLLVGPPGAGKSTINYGLAARISRDGGTVLVCTAEDHLAAVVRPRLEAAEADLNNVHVLTDDLTLPAGVERIRALTVDVPVVLVIIDPLVAFLDGGIDSHKDASVRQALRPLAALAEELASAIVAVVHTNKSASDDPLFRISGSGGFSAAARHVMLACADPSDESGVRRIFAVVKSNLSEFPPPITYTIESATIPNRDGEAIVTSRIRWGEEVPDLDPRALLRPPESEEERGRLESADDFLRGSGCLKRSRPADELIREGDRLGIPKYALQRARKRLGIPSWKDGFEGAWHWGPKAVVEGDTPEGDDPRVSSSSSSEQPAETPARPPEGDAAEETRASVFSDEQIHASITKLKRIAGR